MEQIEKQKSTNSKVFDLTPEQQDKVEFHYYKLKKLHISRNPDSVAAKEQKKAEERKRIPNLYERGQLKTFVSD
jgi:hypothetical protein